MSTGTGATMNHPNAVAPDIGGGDWPMAGQPLPDQGGGSAREILQPSITTFRLPNNLAQCWQDLEATDMRKVLMNGQANPTTGQKRKFRKLVFDRNNPLVVVGGPLDGAPLTMVWNTVPRPRGRWDQRDEPSTPWVHDLAYFLEIGLRDASRPTTQAALEATINKYAGKTIRFEHGLKAECRADKVRYIDVVTRTPHPENPQVLVESSNVQQDPAGVKGCGKKYYTKDLRDKEAKSGEPQYLTELNCEGKLPDGTGCRAVIRAFESFERFAPPLGS